MSLIMNERKKDRSASSSGCGIIDEELVFEILSWLPILSLLLFKSVCKSWRSLIESSDFVSRHFQNNQENKLIILNPHNPRNPYYFTCDFISIPNLQLSKSLILMPLILMPLERKTQNTCETLIASFKGIICFKYKIRVEGNVWQKCWVDDVSLWNPATKHSSILPLPPSCTENEVGLHIDYGVGFDIKTSDYKVVRVILAEHMYDGNMKKSEVEVYSLKTDSWRISDAVVPREFLIMSNPNKPFQNEIYCWFGYDLSKNHPSILSFSFSDETFRVIPVPEVYAYYSDSVLSLTFLRGKIACIDCVPENGKYLYKIWVLDEYGVKESWTELYTIVLDQIDAQMWFSVDEKILFVERKHGKLHLYDPLTREVNESSTQGYISDAAVYKESLVSARSPIGATSRVHSEFWVTSPLPPRPDHL